MEGITEDESQWNVLSASVVAGLESLALGSQFGQQMAHQFLRKTHPSCLPHVLPYLSICGGEGKMEATSVYERSCPEILPNLATPGWVLTHSTDRSCLPAPLACVLQLEESFPAIRREFLALRGAGAFQEYRAPTVCPAADGSGGGGTASTGDGVSPHALGTSATDAGQWSVCYLQLHNATSAEGVGAALERCPVTRSLLASIGPRGYGHAFFSVLAPGSHITRHCGPTNKKVRIHLPLVVPDGDCARLRVGGRTLPLVEGKCIAFQDSWEHEAWLDAHAQSTRATLIIDLWHPMLTDEEVKILKFLRGSAMRATKAASDAGGVIPSEQDFYAVLKSSKDRGCEDGAVFLGCPVVDD